MKDQGETISVFTLMISEIANQKVKISSTAKTGDKSEVSEISMLGISHVNIFFGNPQRFDARNLNKIKG
jgi:hypothetical protein